MSEAYLPLREQLSWLVSADTEMSSQHGKCAGAIGAAYRDASPPSTPSARSNGNVLNASSRHRFGDSFLTQQAICFISPNQSYHLFIMIICNRKLFTAACGGC